MGNTTVEIRTQGEQEVKKQDGAPLEDWCGEMAGSDAMRDGIEAQRRRLAEAIAWCNLQKLQNNPPESDDVKRRRALGERATNHAFAAHQLEAASIFKWVTRGKVKAMRDEASHMYAEARLDEIRPLAAQLRTASLKPSRELPAAEKEEDRAAIVEEVCRKRLALLAESGQSQPLPEPAPAGGKILLSAPWKHAPDPSPGYDSKGFFDAQCAPPWDTWICHAEGCVLSFVPRMLCGLAQRGLEVDPVESLRWADQALLTRLFGSAGISSERVR